MKQKLLLRLGLVALFGTAGFVGLHWLLYPPHRINHEGYYGIDGMNYAEVVEFLGRPPRYQPGELRELSMGVSLHSMMMAQEGYIWESDQARIYVTFHDGKVTGKMMSSGNFEESLQDKLRRWLRM